MRTRRPPPAPIPATGKAFARGPRLLGGALAVASAILSGGCDDPVHDARVAALGPEVPGVRAGPLHRPGQPCMDCHREGGTASAMAVAGTVYRSEVVIAPIAGAEVTLVDAHHRALALITNEAGNFYAYKHNFYLKPPFWVSVAPTEGGTAIPMESPMNLDGNCGTCHQGPKGPNAAGHVFAIVDP